MRAHSAKRKDFCLFWQVFGEIWTVDPSRSEKAGGNVGKTSEGES